MRRVISLHFFFVSIATFLTLSACKKQDQNSKDRALTTKVNLWLDKQKSITHPNQSANIELLKKNLDFSDVHYEQLNNGEKFLIIPILENYKAEKKVEKNNNLQLALVVDELNNIKRGTIAMYIPQPLIKSAIIPVGTLSKMYHNEAIEINGMIRFLSVSGRWLYEYVIKDGKIFSTGFIRQADDLDSKNEATKKTSNCIDWYLVTTYYENGVVVDEEEVYLGRTCYGCDNSDLMSICPIDYDGIGEGNVTDVYIDCCLPDPNALWTCQHTAVDILSSPEPENTDPATGVITKTWPLSWYYDFNSLLGWHWNYKSYETATLEKLQNNSWKFISLVHNSHDGMEGSIPPCVEFHHFVDAVTPTIENNGSRARVTIVMHDTFRISCIPTSGTTSDTGTSSMFWDAN